jgi:hypothetical protein
MDVIAPFDRCDLQQHIGAAASAKPLFGPSNGVRKLIDPEAGLEEIHTVHVLDHFLSARQRDLRRSLAAFQIPADLQEAYHAVRIYELYLVQIHFPRAKGGVGQRMELLDQELEGAFLQIGRGDNFVIRALLAGPGKVSRGWHRSIQRFYSLFF